MPNHNGGRYRTPKTRHTLELGPSEYLVTKAQEVNWAWRQHRGAEVPDQQIDTFNPALADALHRAGLDPDRGEPHRVAELSDSTREGVAKTGIKLN